MFVDQKNLNRTLEIDSPFQTFVVELLVKFIDYSRNSVQRQLLGTGHFAFVERLSYFGVFFCFVFNTPSNDITEQI